MSFDSHITPIQKELRRAGYSIIRKPWDTSTLSKENAIIDIEVIGRKDFFNILYLEADSSWKSISTEIVQKNDNPCLVITRYGETHHIFTTLANYGTSNKKSRHIVIKTRSRSELFSKFINTIKAKPNDDHISINNTIQKAFDKFSAYQQAIDEFAENLDIIIQKTRDDIKRASTNNKLYQKNKDKLLEMCRSVISNQFEEKDITEMLIQHVLTAGIFSRIYDKAEFHKINTIAKNLEQLISLLKPLNIDVDYTTIELVAEATTNIKEKEDLLKKVYETFYRKYNPVTADTQGIVYTPHEVVDFMVRSSAILLKKHFKKSMSDKNVKILDPATGTGTFITYILQEINKESLPLKFRNDIFANDVSLLAYYIAALNIENTYKEITGVVEEFENICWMDTLDTGAENLKIDAWFGQTNIERIGRQQKSPICMVIGNPPYDALQVNFEDNKTKEYPEIDSGDTEKSIKDTYVKYSRSKNKNLQYDMYKKFMRWSTNRIKDKGIVAFVSNNSFLDAKADDGFRKIISEEFDYIYVVNLKGNTRVPEWEKEGEKIFGSKARVGISISFFIKTGLKENGKTARIQYSEVADFLKRDKKLLWLKNNSIETLRMKDIIPDDKHNWLNQSSTDFSNLIPIISDEPNDKSIFYKKISGYKTHRDPWVHDFNPSLLENKIKFLIKICNKLILQRDSLDSKKISFEVHNKKTRIIDSDNNDCTKKYSVIKLSESLLNHLRHIPQKNWSKDNIKYTLYRPFTHKYLYYDSTFIDREREFSKIMKYDNKFILVSSPGAKQPFNVLATTKMVDTGCIGATQCIPLLGENSCNITKWAHDAFKEHYNMPDITKEEIFYYVYAILNDPKYIRKYKNDLRREFPRIPCVGDFKKWTKLGRKLFVLHSEFEDQDEYPLRVKINEDGNSNNSSKQIKPILSIKKNDAGKNIIKIDKNTILSDVPNSVTDYMIGHKSALDWMLEFYKLSKNIIPLEYSNDEKICIKYSKYNFELYKTRIITLCKKITYVSECTMELRNQLQELDWGDKILLEKNSKGMHQSFVKDSKKSKHRRIKHTSSKLDHQLLKNKNKII